MASGQVLVVPSTGWCLLAVAGVRASASLRAQPQIWEERYGTPGALFLPSEVRVLGNRKALWSVSCYLCLWNEGWGGGATRTPLCHQSQANLWG